MRLAAATGIPLLANAAALALLALRIRADIRRDRAAIEAPRRAAQSGPGTA